MGPGTTMDNEEQEGGVQAPGQPALYPPGPAVPLVWGEEAVQTLLACSVLCWVDCRGQQGREDSGAEGVLDRGVMSQAEFH